MFENFWEFFGNIHMSFIKNYLSPLFWWRNSRRPPNFRTIKTWSPMVSINPKATDWGPFGPRTRLTTDIFCVSYFWSPGFYEFVTKMVLQDWQKTELDYLLRFFSYSRNLSGSGAKICIFPYMKKNQKIISVVLTIDFPLLFNIDQKS